MPGLDVDEDAIRGVFVRHIPADGDPLYEPVEVPDGRWQRGAQLAAWYLADEPETAWAEWYRALAGTGLPPSRALPRDLWNWSVDLHRVALLDTDERLARVGLPTPRPTRAQWAACQAVGQAACDAGFDALLVASAARPSQRNLVVFRHARASPDCTPLPPPQRIAAPPPVPRGLRT